MTLSIGDVSAATGLSVHTLRMYERDGLLTTVLRRDAGGRRVYTEDDVQWLANVRIFRSSGMPLAVIARFAELVREGEGNEEERLRLLHEHADRIAVQQQSIEAARELIAAKIDSYEAHLARGTASSLWITEPAATPR